MNTDYFSIIDTHEKAYWLGFLYADGYHLEKYNKIGMQLSIRDIKHIEKFCKCLDIKNKIKSTPPFSRKICGRVVNSDGLCSINFGSKKMSIDLTKLGLISKKSLVLKFPDEKQLPENFINSFILGYFDGDGCLSQSYSDSCSRFGVTILSSEEFCNSLIDVVKKLIDVKVKLWNKSPLDKIRKVHISGNIQTQTFMDWLYKDSNVFLDRKYEIYKSLCENSNRIKNKFLNKSSIYNNITFDKDRNTWNASIRINKKTKLIGRYVSEEDAYKAQQEAYNTYASRCVVINTTD